MQQCGHGTARVVCSSPAGGGGDGCGVTNDSLQPMPVFTTNRLKSGLPLPACSSARRGLVAFAPSQVTKQLTPVAVASRGSSAVAVYRHVMSNHTPGAPEHSVRCSGTEQGPSGEKHRLSPHRARVVVLHSRRALHEAVGDRPGVAACPVYTSPPPGTEVDTSREAVLEDAGSTTSVLSCAVEPVMMMLPLPEVVTPSLTVPLPSALKVMFTWGIGGTGGAKQHVQQKQHTR
jgi:hypothetical protein